MQSILNTYRRAAKQPRQELLPIWIKAFMHFFLATIILLPLVVIFSILDINAPMGIYGIESNSVLNITGLIILTLLTLKVIVAFQLLSSRDLALHLAIVDATVGVLFCLWMLIGGLVYGGDDVHIEFRLELILLFPYLFFSIRTIQKWKSIGIESGNSL